MLQLCACRIAVTVRTHNGREGEGGDPVGAGRGVIKRHNFSGVNAVAGACSVLTVRVVDFHVPIALRLKANFYDIRAIGRRGRSNGETEVVTIACICARASR